MRKNFYNLLTLLLFLSPFSKIFAQSDSLIFRDDFNRSAMGENWITRAWSIVNDAAYNNIDGTGGILKTNRPYSGEPSYIIETAAKGFTLNYYREFRITFGQRDLLDDSTYVLSYTPYSNGKLTLSLSTDNIYFPSSILDEVIIHPNLNSTTWYKFKIAKYKSGLIQVYLDKGDGYSAIPLLEAIDSTHKALGHFGWQVDTQTAAEDFFVDFIEAKKPAVEKPAIREKPADDDLIAQVNVKSEKSYAISKLYVGANLYTDRNYTITSVPKYLLGASYIQTANDDKKNTSDDLLTVFLKKDAIVYVGYDPRSTSLPDWLKGWAKTGDTIGVTDPGSSYMEIYSKLVESNNPLYLPGNLQSPAKGANMNYIVAAVERPILPTFQAEEATISGAIVATDKAGYNGTGFVDYVNSSSDFIEWDIPTDYSGTYNLGFRFANGGTSSRFLQIAVNGKVVGNFEFSSTSNWSSWAFLSGGNVYLPIGTNKIRATAIGSSGPNIDELNLYYVSSDSPLPNTSAREVLENEEVAIEKLKVYPNPSHSSVKISYYLKEKSKVYLSILSIESLNLKVLVNGIQEAGEHEALFDAQSLKDGMYVYKLQIGSNIKTGKILKN